MGWEALTRLPDTVQAGPTGPQTYSGWGSEVEHRDSAREAPRRPEAESECVVPHIPGSRVGQRVRGKAWWRPRTTHCCPLAMKEGERSGKAQKRCSLQSAPSCDPEMEEFALLLKMWVPREPAAEQKQNETKDSPPGPPPGQGEVRTLSPEEQLPPSLGRPSQGRLPLRLPPDLAGAWMGWALLLRPATCCLGGGCCRRLGGGSSWSSGQDVLNRLRLLLCRGKLLGKVFHSVAEEAGLADRGVEEPHFVGLTHVCQVQPQVSLLDMPGRGGADFPVRR
jgi:hypothetical protein